MIKRLILMMIAIALSVNALSAGKLHYVKDMNGEDYFPLGVNYAWKDWGRDFADKGWPERFEIIKADLDLMKKRGVRTLRWWIYTDFVESPLWTGKGDKLRCTGMPQGWVENFIKVADEAHKRGIRLYPVFSSFDLGRKGFKWVVSDKAVRNSFIKNAVRPVLEAAGEHPGIFAWDIINEPEWLVSKTDGGDPNKELSDGPVRLSDLRAYLHAMSKEIKKRAKQPVTVGSAGLKWCGWQYDFYSGLGLDFFDVHYYDWMTPWFDITKTPKTDLKLNKEYQRKAIIVGETIAQPKTQYTGAGAPKDHGQFLRDIMAMGYAGYLPWAWYEGRPDWSCSETIDPHFNEALKTLSLPGVDAP